MIKFNRASYNRVLVGGPLEEQVSDRRKRSLYPVVSESVFEKYSNCGKY